MAEEHDNEVTHGDQSQGLRIFLHVKKQTEGLTSTTNNGVRQDDITITLPAPSEKTMNNWLKHKCQNERISDMYTKNDLSSTSPEVCSQSDVSKAHTISESMRLKVHSQSGVSNSPSQFGVSTKCSHGGASTSQMDVKRLDGQPVTKKMCPTNTQKMCSQSSDTMSLRMHPTSSEMCSQSDVSKAHTISESMRLKVHSQSSVSNSQKKNSHSGVSTKCSHGGASTSQDLNGAVLPKCQTNGAAAQSPNNVFVVNKPGKELKKCLPEILQAIQRKTVNDISNACGISKNKKVSLDRHGDLRSDEGKNFGQQSAKKIHLESGPSTSQDISNACGISKKKVSLDRHGDSREDVPNFQQLRLHDISSKSHNQPVLEIAESSSPATSSETLQNNKIDHEQQEIETKICSELFKYYDNDGVLDVFDVDQYLREICPNNAEITSTSSQDNYEVGD